jgi:outer membrane protein OmpA-like peptidoglycan-associated protein
VDPGRIYTSGKGEALPVASNDSASGRQRNRRVEVIIQNAAVTSR